MIWRDGDERYVQVSGTGSISCRGITEEQGREAEERKQPIGFRLRPILQPATEKTTGDLDELIEHHARVVLAASASRRERLVVAEIASWGECAWTARDCLVVAE